MKKLEIAGLTEMSRAEAVKTNGGLGFLGAVAAGVVGGIIVGEYNRWRNKKRRR